MSDWTARAACRREDPELFFPIGTGPLAAAQAEDAKLICSVCPVADDCLRTALTLGNVEGIWGGTTEAERKRIRRNEYERSRRQVRA